MTIAFVKSLPPLSRTVVPRGFNKRKKRDDIEPGDVRDYEPGTLYFERHRKKGR